MELIETKPKTYDDYAKLPEGAAYQLIGGEIIMVPAPDLYHQDILGNIYDEMRRVVRSKKLGRVYVAPADVYFGEHDTFQPDIVFVSNERMNILKGKRIEGAPDIVIEILSPSTGYYDLAHKKDVYEEFGVKEYWIVDPKVRSIEVLENVNGKFTTHTKLKKKGAVSSKVPPDFTLDLDTIFEV